MPRIREFYGIVIYMHFSDHAPAHFHAIYGGHEALVGIHDGAILRGDLPRTAGRLVAEWALLHRAELAANWERAQVPEPLLPVKPLR